MKRLAALGIAVAFVFGSLGSAQAIEVKASMVWELGFGWADNLSFSDAKQAGHDDAFSARQKIRPQFNFIASETLEAVLQLEIGTTTWGSNDDNSGGALDADSATATIRRAHLDWSPHENLRLRMGMQGVALPSAAFGNPILDTDVAGVVASYRFNDTVNLTAFWLRPFDGGWDNGQTDGKNSNDEMDIFGFSLPISGENFSVTPWAMYARLGNNADYWAYRAGEDDASNLFGTGLSPKGTSNMWWAGAAIELDFLNPFSIKLDGMYGASRTSGDNAPEFSGWLVAGLFEYNTESMWGNPGLIAWYASGDDSDDYKDGAFGSYGRMPVISTDRAGFAPTAYGFSGTVACMQDSLISTSGVGTWGLGLQLDGMSFVDELSHTFRVAYIRGTNDEDMVRNNPNIDRLGSPYNIMGDAVYMTKQDHAWEADFLTSYKVHENLTLFLEANYIWMSLDSDVWGSNSKTTNAWKTQVVFVYSF